jgi:assimilatory nitrate reductase catalytic subunit
MSIVRTTCPYCGVGCGVIAKQGNAAIEISGDSAHPANRGRLCSKGAALGETLGHEGRLLYPAINGERVQWNTALDHVAHEFKRIIDTHGRDSVAFYVSGQILTEDYYVANKLMKGFIGSANIDTNSRLCMSSAVTGHKRAFGEDLVPVCYEDLDSTDLVVLVGSNTAWCHPVLFQRIAHAKQQRPEMKVIVIDPRRTPTCDIADLHLPVKAGTDVWLFNGLLAYLHQHGIEDADFVREHTRDVQRALVVAENTAGDVRAVAKQCGVDLAVLTEFYRLFARTTKVMTCFSQGVNQSSSGTDKVNSIINCHLLTGRIGIAGAGPFSLTGQPNAMGGREVGGMANMLAAHMDLENVEHRRTVQDFWRSPKIAQSPGLKAVDLFDAIHERRIKAVWIMATNPVVSLPNADKVREALRRCELVVVSDCVANTDTTALAHVVLPAAAWGEKDGTITNSDRHISRQRAFMAAPGEARPDWWALSQVGQRLGFDSAFAFESAHEVFLEHALLSATDNDGSRAFDIGALSALTTEQYDALNPIQWPVRASAQQGTARLFEDKRFFHPDGKARFVPTPPRAPMNKTDSEFTFVLNTMTRTGTAPRLTSHIAEPYVDMHPQDVLLSGVKVDELVRVTTRWGSMVARLRTSGEIPRGTVFVPIHWSDTFSSDARVGALVNPAVDPVSGEPEFKHTPVRVEPFIVSWHGFILSRTPLQMDTTWWSQSRSAKFMRYELAGRRAYGDWSQWARRIMKAAAADADWLEYSDPSVYSYRAVHMAGDRIEACIFIAPRPELPSRSWLASLFDKKKLSDADRYAVLTGKASDPANEAGSLVCSCFGVGRNTLCNAIRSQGLKTTQQIGQKLKAGTNCGSCLPELNALLQEVTETAPV